MFCKKCGAQINDEAVVCPKCGCRTDNYEQPAAKKSEPDKTSVGIVIASVLLPIVGVIMGIVNLCKKKTSSGLTYLITGIVAWVIWGVLFSAF